MKTTDRQMRVRPGASAPRSKPIRRRAAADAAPRLAASEATTDATTLVERPDGWYWVAPDGKQQFGPFETCSLARVDRDRYGVSDSVEAVTESEALRQGELAVGVAEWVGAETGAPAEGQSPPHLDEH